MQANWTETPKARRLLAAFDPASLCLVRHTPLMGERCWQIEGTAPNGEELTRELAKLRTEHVEALTGLTLAADPEAFLAAWNEQPDPQDFLAERFGAPPHFYGEQDSGSRDAWKDAALARLAQELAA